MKKSTENVKSSWELNLGPYIIDAFTSNKSFGFGFGLGLGLGLGPVDLLHEEEWKQVYL